MSPEAKEKARWRRIFLTYGITQDQYNELDKGHCPICLRTWESGIQPVVDHDHSLGGSVRGIICRWCNKFVVGRHKDPAVVYRVYEYLRDAPRNLIVPAKKRKRRKKKI